VAKVKNNPRRGSTLDDFLEREGVRGEFEARAVKEVIAWQLLEAMKTQAISKAKMAIMMNTSRAQLDRLLNPERDVQLSTLARAAAIVGRQIRLELT
jgi:antitoxin HicB